VNKVGTVLRLLHDLTGVDARDRARAADEVTSLVGTLRPEEVHAVAAVLVMARLAETSPPAQEAMLRAILELNTWHRPLPPAVLARVWDVDPASVTGAQVEYFMALFTGRPRA
jgi:hypothetical protein